MLKNGPEFGVDPSLPRGGATIEAGGGGHAPPHYSIWMVLLY